MYIQARENNNRWNHCQASSNPTLKMGGFAIVLFMNLLLDIWCKHIIRRVKSERE